MATETTETIVWNGCDGYLTVEDAKRQGYDFDDRGNLCHGAHAHAPFPVIRVMPNQIPRNEEGEMVDEGLYFTQDYSAWRRV
jgi:hypothetical protein